MKIATIIVRSLLGLIFVVFGLNFFLHFIPIPPRPEGPARDFMTALAVSHYFFVVCALEFVGGVLLLAGRLVPLGLTLLGLVIVNILCVHIFPRSKRCADGPRDLGIRTVSGLALPGEFRRACEGFSAVQSFARPSRHH